MRNLLKQLLSGLVILTGLYHTSLGQDFLPTLNDNYMGINQVFLQPASIADNLLNSDYHIGGFSNDITNDGIHFRSRWLLYPTSILTNENWWDENSYLGEPNGKDKNMFMSQSALGPGFMITLSEKHAIGFTSRVRSILNIDGMDEPLFRLLYSNFRETAYNNKWYYDQEMRASQHIFGDYGLTYARVVDLGREDHFLKAGITVKLLQGIASAYLQMDELYYYFNGEAFPESKDMSFNSSYIYSGLSDNWGDLNQYGSYTFSMNYQWTAKPSLGVDFGAVYELRKDVFGKGKLTKNEQGKGEYFLKVGLSVLDLGRLKYEKDYYSSDYIAAFTADYQDRYTSGDNTVPINTDWLDMNDVSLSARDYADFSYAMHQLAVNGQGLQKAPSNKEKFTFRLPSTINLQADLNLDILTEGLFINYTSQHALFQGYKNAPNSHYIGSYSITPRYEKKWYSFAVPVQVDQYGKLNIGLGIRAGIFYAGVNNLFTNIFNDPYGMHAYVGIKVPVHYKKTTDINTVVDKTHPADSLAKMDKISGDIVILKDSFNQTYFIDDHSDNSQEINFFGNDGGSGGSGSGGSGSGDGQGPVGGDPGNNGNGPGASDGDGKDQGPGKKINPSNPIIAPQGPGNGKDKREPLPPNSHIPNIVQHEKPENNDDFAPINFAFGDTKNSLAVNKSYLDSLAIVLMSRPELKITIEGHTDNVGSEAFNMNLSKIRAEETRNYLISKGVSGEQLSVKWYGESKPLNEELKDTQEGRDMNRRVEFRIERQT